MKYLPGYFCIHNDRGNIMALSIQDMLDQAENITGQIRHILFNGGDYSQEEVDILVECYSKMVSVYKDLKEITDGLD